jgi:hypothetical protein
MGYVYGLFLVLFFFEEVYEEGEKEVYSMSEWHEEVA